MENIKKFEQFVNEVNEIKYNESKVSDWLMSPEFGEFGHKILKDRNVASKIKKLRIDLDERYDKQDIGYKKVTYIHMMNDLISLFNRNRDKDLSIDWKELFDYIWEMKEYMIANTVLDQFTIYKVAKKINKFCEEYGYEKIKDNRGEIVGD